MTALRAVSSRQPARAPGNYKILPVISRLARILIALALLSTAVLLIASLSGVPDQLHARLSSAPLALAGLCYALLQTTLRPSRTLLLKRLLLAATFVAWAVDQLLPPGAVATFLGDLVIGAYVLDLFWIMQEQSAG
jgi:hypothetical protein